MARHGRRKKNRTHVPVEELPSSNAPKSFVIKSGIVGHSVARLVQDLRKVLEPNTALRLKERKSNKLKDFVHVAAQYKVTHFLLFSQPAPSFHTNLRIARVPRGPTLTFRVKNYSLMKDVASISAKPKSPGTEYLTPPLLVLNNFSAPTDEKEAKAVKLCATVFQNLFPAINVSTLKLSEARRVVLVNYNATERSFELRHFIINVRVTGVSRAIKRVINTNTSFPNLANAADISDFILGHVNSESEAEEDSKVELPDNYLGRNNSKNSQRAIKLVEVGPRMELDLLKIEAGLCEGEVIFHSYCAYMFYPSQRKPISDYPPVKIDDDKKFTNYFLYLVQKTPAEIRAMELKREQAVAEKSRRRKEQEENVEKKRKLKEQQAERDRKRVRIENQGQSEDASEEETKEEDSSSSVNKNDSLDS